MSNHVGDCFKFFGLLRKPELYQTHGMKKNSGSTYFYFSPLLIAKRKEREKKACCFRYCLRKLLRKLVSMTSFSKMRAKITRNFSPAQCILTLCIFKWKWKFLNYRLKYLERFWNGIVIVLVLNFESFFCDLLASVGLVNKNGCKSQH